MASQGPLYPGTVTTETGPSGDNDWTNPGNVSANDGAEAQITAATYDAGDHSFRLKAQNFGFTVPSDATIDGIVVEIERRDFAGDAQDQEVRLYNAAGTLVGDDKQTATSWPATATIATYGSSSDTWAASPTPAMVNDPDFGVALIVLANSANTDIGVDFIRVTVHYTPSPNVTVTPDPVAIPLVVPVPTLQIAPADAYGVEVYADSPSAWFRMGEASGDVLDFIPSGTDGATNGTVTRDVAGATGDSDDGAINFDGSTGYVSVADHDGLDLGDGPFSIELWLKRERTTTTEELVTKGSNSPVVAIVSDKVGLWGFGLGLSVEETGTTTDTDWHHIVVTHDGTTSKIYKDKVDVSGTSTNRAFASNANALNIGRNTGGSGYFDGSIDEVAFYKSVLSSTRVAAHYDAATASGDVTVTPSPVTIPLVVPAPTVAVDRVVTPSPVAVPLVVPTPAVQVDRSVSPDPVAVPLVVPAPAIQVGAQVTPDPVSLVLVVPVPTITAEGGAPAVTVTPDPVAVVLAIPTPSIQSGRLVSPSPVALPLVIPSPSIAAGALVSPSPVAVPLVVPAPSIQAGRIVTPSPVTIPLLIPAPAIAIGARVTPSPVVINLVIPAPTITASGALPPGFLDELLELAVAGDVVTVENLDGGSAGMVIVVTIAGVGIDAGGVLELDVEG